MRAATARLGDRRLSSECRTTHAEPHDSRTYLHRLMAADPQFSYALMYELFFPSLLEKGVLRLLFRVDAVFGRRLRHRLDAIEEHVQRRYRQY
jgi:hypothetical protein